MKEVLKVEADEEFDTTEVEMRVPEFQNFGQRMGELELKAHKIVLATPLDLDAAWAGLDRMGGLWPWLAKLATIIEWFLKAMRRKEPDSTKQEPEQEPDPKEFEHDLQRLRVSLPEGMEWNPLAEAKVDRFLADWPALRPAVLNATLKYYKDFRPEVADFFGEEAQYVLPEATAPEVVADLFRISTIHLHPDDAIGLGGYCTWDEEHGYGALIKSGAVTVGHEDEAFA